MKTGDVVMFSAPMNEAEKQERYEILEDRGERVLVKYLNASLKVAPTYVFRKDELKLYSNEK